MKIMRVLEYEGDSDWINKVMEKNWLQLDKKELGPGRSVTETYRAIVIEKVPK